MVSWITIILLTYSMTVTRAANILYVIPFTSTSHYIMLSPIGLELARRGHNVTVITGHKEKNPPATYHEVVIDDKKIWDILGIERPNVFTMVDTSAEMFHYMILWTGGVAFTEVVLNSSNVQEFLKKDNTFDLVIVEQFFNEALYSLSYKYNAPLALVTTFGNCMRHNIITHSPLQLSTVVPEFVDIRNPTSFAGRLKNFYFVIFEYVIWKFWYMKQQEDLALKYIPDAAESPSLYELQKNSSLMLINGHFSYDKAFALPPNTVEIGGVHLTNNHGNLSQDLKEILDNSKHGVVYMNFGSNVRSFELPIEKRNAFLNVFKTLKQNILWKWEDEELYNKSDNVFIRKWMPQKEILAHPNVKAFISHGGLIGTQEAIYNGVPIIGVPIYADQYNNLLLAEEEGYGKILEYHHINEVNLYKHLNEILSNSCYIDKAKEMSRRFKDRPMSPLDTAMYWLEYVIRNKGADFIKNPSRNLSWISYSMIDVFAFVIIVTVILVLLFVKLVYLLTHFIRSVIHIKIKID